MKYPIDVLAAIYKAGTIMASADGTILREEYLPLLRFFQSLENYSEDLLREIVAYSNENMDIPQALITISNLDIETKQRLLEILVAIANQDNDIADKECEIFNAFLSICSAPTTEAAEDSEEAK